MNWAIGLEVGLKEIGAHKVRSFLTMLGVILGVASLVSMFAIMEGEVARQLETLQAIGGVERVSVRDKEPSSENRHIAELSPGRTMLDAESLKRGAPLIKFVAPQMTGGATVTFENKSFSGRFMGVTRETFHVDNHNIAAGRFIADLDVERAKNVVVLGHSPASALFPEVPAEKIIGRTIWVNQRPFIVIGLLERYERESDRRARKTGRQRKFAERREKRGGIRSGWDPNRWKNESVLIPITRFAAEFRTANVDENNNDAGPNLKLDELILKLADFRMFDAALQQVTAILQRTHRGIDDFGFDTREDFFDSIQSSQRAARITGGVIAGISLVVGGIGITNIMLASITERVREIGIRMAVGARRLDIFAQILAESTVIGLIGGILGLLLSISFINGLQTLFPNEVVPIVKPSAVVTGFSFAVMVGVLAGVYPAFRASRLHPIEALRYE